MNTPTAGRPAESRTASAQSVVEGFGPVPSTDDPRWTAALAAFAETQRVFDLAHRSNRVPELERAYVYQRRAEAFNTLAQLAPLDTPVPFIRALFVAATADAEIAREYERRAAGSGDPR